MGLLTNDKNLVKEFVRINFINSVSSFPDWELAEERFLLPLIGDAMYEKVKAVADASPDQDKELLRRCQAVVAPLAYLLELPTIQTQITDAGLRSISTENMQAAHRWEYNEIKEHLSDKGVYAMESLLRFLFVHKDDYAEWTGSPEYQEASSLVFTTGEEFNKYFPVPQPHRMFWTLRPLIKEVEDFYISSAIGEDFFEELKAKANPTEDEKNVLILIKKAVAQTTIVKAVEKLSVRYTANGFTVLLSAGSIDAANSGDAEGKDNQLSLLHESCQRSGDAYLLKLQELLNNKAAADVFATYFASEYYQPPATEQEDRNANRKQFGFF